MWFIADLANETLFVIDIFLIAIWHQSRVIESGGEVINADFTLRSGFKEGDGIVPVDKDTPFTDSVFRQVQSSDKDRIDKGCDDNGHQPKE